MSINSLSESLRYSFLVPRLSIVFGALAVLLGFISNSFVVNYVAVIVPAFIFWLYVIRRYALLWFFVFVYIVYVFPYFLIFLEIGDFSSWRQGLIRYEDNESLLAHMARMIGLGLLVVGLIGLRFPKLKSFKYSNGEGVAARIWSRRVRYIVYGLGGIPVFIFFYFVAGKDRGSLLLEFGASDVAALNIAFMLVYLCGAYFISRGSAGGKWMFGFFLSLLSALLFAYAGFRYCLIGLMLMACTAYMQGSSVRVIRVLFFLILALVAYLLLTLIALSRNLGRGVIEVAVGFFSGDLDVSLLLSSAGAHEQNIYYSLYEVFVNDQVYYGSLYIDSIIRILPSFMYGSFFETIRTADVIASIAAPKELVDARLNLGGFFMAESYLNFGLIGSYFVFVFSVVFFFGVELWRKSRPFWGILYYVMVALLPSYIYYGFNSFFKMLTYSMVVLLVLFFVARVRFGLFQASSK